MSSYWHRHVQENGSQVVEGGQHNHGQWGGLKQKSILAKQCNF